MTEKLFHSNPYEICTDAKVVSLEKKHGIWELVCDRTVFYPEGGGQPADRGTISGIPVIDVRKRDDVVVHTLELHPQCNPGDTVSMELDWNHRYEYMQQHSGQHIISAVFYRALGIGTLSVHLGESYATIETDRSEITDGEISQTEDLVQDILCSNMPITDQYISQEEMDDIDLRREPQVAGTVRVIRIGGYDAAPCGGVHVGSTGEVRLVKCISREKIRGHVRTVWKIGQRAAADYRELTDITLQLSTLLSVPRDGIISRVETVLEDQKRLQLHIQHLESSLAVNLIAQMSNRAELVDHVRIVSETIQVSDASIIRHMNALLPQDYPLVFCCVCISEQSLRWLIGVTGGVQIDFSAILKEVLPIIEGKGGGRYPLWQGAGTRAEGAEEFTRKIRRWIRQYLTARN